MKTVPWKVVVIAELAQVRCTYIVFSVSAGNAAKKALNRFKAEKNMDQELGRGHGDMLVRITRSSKKEADAWTAKVLR